MTKFKNISNFMNYKYLLCIILIMLFSDSAFSQEFDLGPWLKYCTETKSFIVNSKVFGAEDFSESLDQLSFDSELLMINGLVVPIEKGEKITKFKSPHRSLDFVIDFEYESGLNIIVSQKNQEIEYDIHKRFFDTLEKSYFEQLIGRAGSLPKPLESWISDGFAIDFFRLTGPFQTEDELQCEANSIAKDIQIIVLLFAQGVQPFSIYNQEIDRVWLKSENTLSGIVSKTLRPPTGDRYSEFVYWNGEFINNEKVIQVLVYYPIGYDGKYGHLGWLLADPSALNDQKNRKN